MKFRDVKKAIKTGDIKNTAMEVTPFLLDGVLDPSIIIGSDFSTAITKISLPILQHYLGKFFNEYKQLRDSNKINKVPKTEKPILALTELLKIINSGEIDEEKFKAIKSIFFSGVAQDSNESDEFWSYEFLQTAKMLNGTEILILKANFDIVNHVCNDKVSATIKNGFLPWNRSAWRNIVSLQMNLVGAESLVFKSEEKLEKLGLISPRQEKNNFSEEFVAVDKDNYRLTLMGLHFCAFITKYKD